MKIYKWICCFFIILLFIRPIYPAEKMKEEGLSEKYREWLKVTSYIILPQEKDVFLQLASDRDRDLFIQAFWRHRDPTPGTPQNEYKQEHLKRFAYANAYYKRGTPREGWMTDMGKIHIILGPPSSIERFDSEAGIHPCQVWYYYGDKTKGLPTYFAIIFFQRGGAGEYKLYNPTTDGPGSLLIGGYGRGVADYRAVYQKIKELAPSLAGVAISMIPGQIPPDYQPTPRNNIILANIFESPKKELTPTYATHFLNYRGIVSTEYLTNYIESFGLVALTRDPVLDMNFVHFSINPKSFSADYFEPKDQYFCNFQLNVSVRHDQEVIFQYSKDFPFYFEPSAMERIKGKGISIQDSFPLIEGKYRLIVLIQNSVGKEFSVFEKDVNVPESTGLPGIISPVLGFKAEQQKDPLHMPFKVAETKILVDPENTISPSEEVVLLFNLVNISDEMRESGKIRILVNGLGHRDPIKKSFTLELKTYPSKETLVITHSIPAKEFSPDYYEMHLILEDGEGNTIDEKKTQFILSSQAEVPHPVTLAKSFPVSNNFLYSYSFAYQYDKVKNFQSAEEYYEDAYRLKPDYNRGIVEYSNFLLKIRKFEKSLDFIEKVSDDEEMKFQYHLVKGKALLGMEKYQEAIESLLEGNKIYNSDVGLLNSLGLCYYKIGRKEEALDVLKASLRLNANQKDIKKLIDDIEKNHD